ncbi:MAG: DUF2085 domain-containing protein [Bacteroidota bacterium]
MNIRKIALGFFAALTVWMAGIVFNLICAIADNNLLVFSPAVKLMYSHVCHQLPAKTISVSGMPFMLCARCSGLYTGAFIMSLLLLLPVNGGAALSRRMNFRHLIFISLPMLADTILYRTGLYSYSKTLAFVTGILSGSAGFLYILGAFDKRFFTTTNSRN